MLLSALSLLSNKHSSFDINLHDTYFVISMAAMCQILVVTLIILWLFYFLADSILPLLTLRWLHIAITATVFSIVILKIWLLPNPAEAPRRYYDFVEYQQQKQHMDTIIYSTIIMSLLISQILFLINLVAGIFKKISPINS
ncbi:hypothetical protein [Mucilaginibacter rubeus]|uniref:Uncharacterized protein n=1 Tax=Mucilaginibacter rubeus TaxID=2027860 RepID=A0A5C1HZ08_9SPHI|nr:hypothetical protein [Mucilaginibacter rubeus]QEM10068.1 hypothetical protein DEO27_008535 [Mucilaginibacter rubeus]